MNKCEPKSGLERELESVRDVVRALKRLDSRVERLRMINTAFAYVEGSRIASVTVKLQTGGGVTWSDDAA